MAGRARVDIWQSAPVNGPFSSDFWRSHRLLATVMAQKVGEQEEWMARTNKSPAGIIVRIRGGRSIVILI